MKDEESLWTSLFFFPLADIKKEKSWGEGQNGRTKTHNGKNPNHWSLSLIEQTYLNNNYEKEGSI